MLSTAIFSTRSSRNKPAKTQKENYNKLGAGRKCKHGFRDRKCTFFHGKLIWFCFTQPILIGQSFVSMLITIWDKLSNLTILNHPAAS